LVDGDINGNVPTNIRQLKVVTSKFYAFFGSNSRTIYEIKTLIIENENCEAQLQPANTAPNTNYFHTAYEQNE